MRNPECDKQMLDSIIIRNADASDERIGTDVYATTEIGGVVAFKSTKNNDRFAHSEICMLFFPALHATFSHCAPCVCADCDSWIAVGTAEPVYTSWRATSISHVQYKSTCFTLVPRLMCDIRHPCLYCEFRWVLCKNENQNNHFERRWFRFMPHKFTMKERKIQSLFFNATNSW